MSPLRYLKQELNFAMSEWKELTERDKADLKRWAAEEMEVLGMTAAAA